MRLWMLWVAMVLVSSPALADDASERLIQKGVALEARFDYDAALDVYRELERMRGQEGTSLFLQARVAFHRKDYTGSRSLAQRAVGSATGTWRYLAKVLYGDTLLATGLAQRAKLVFIALHDQTPGDRRELVKRVIACNKQLRLPDRDGL